MIRIFATVGLAVSLIISPAGAETLDGIYRGTIAIDKGYPIRTKFWTDEAGVIRGDWVYKAANGGGAGYLRFCSLKQRRLHCVWDDTIYTGDFVALFSEDFQSFEGASFGEVSSQARTSLETGIRWDGRRQ